MRFKYAFFAVIPLLLTLVLLSPIVAQSSDVILTVGVQEWQMDAISDKVIEEFQEQNPGIKVVVKPYPGGDDQFYSLDLNDIDASLDKAEKFVGTADVLELGTYQFSVELTRAGYLLDMTPLIKADPDAGLDDFYPVGLNSYQIDGGTWALPLSVQLNLMVYDKTAFDAAGQMYPDENWTLNDFIEAGKALTVRDANGKTTVPGFYGFDDRILYRSLLGHGLYDSSAFPELPALNDPELAAMMTEWTAYQKELFPDEGGNGGDFDYDRIPLTVQGTWRLTQNFTGDTREWGASLLPGGAVVTAEGLAISAGTQYPEAAYKLIQFLTKTPDTVYRFYGDSPARRSMVSAETDDQIYRPDIPADVQTLIDNALENSIPASEMRYFDYLWIATSKMAEDNLDIDQALQAVQELAVDNLAKAAARKGNAILAVATPVPTPVLNDDEIALNFIYFANMYPMPNRDKWDALIERFVADDPEVGQIVFNTSAASQEEYEAADCIYSGQNPVTNADLKTLLPLDPMIASDPNFDASDMMGNAMSLVTREGQVWGLPIHIQPAVIWYDSKKFEEAGAFEPYVGWDTSDFEAALRTLKDANPDDEPFVISTYGNSYLLTLMSAYGGMPVDYTTDPTTYHLTDPAVVEAVRQVLKLAKDGLIKYQALDTNSFSSGSSDATMYDAYLSLDDWRMSMRSADEDTYKLALFPRGTNAQPISFSLGTGTISSKSLHPEACYRWMMAIAGDAELYTAMPARRSLLDDPALKAALGPDVVDMYKELDTYFQNPDLVVMPGQFGGGGSYGSFITDVWMNRAFDNIVLKDADPETELANAQSIIADFGECTADFPKLEEMTDYTPDESQKVFLDFVNCGVSLDDSMRERFSYILNQSDD